jgi:maleate isomerase
MSGNPGSATNQQTFWQNFLAMIPPDVQLDYFGNLGGNQDDPAARLVEAGRQAERDGVQGLMVRSAPTEVASPTILEQLRAAVKIPVTTAMLACATALQTLGARNVLLLTPFDESLNKEIRAILSKRGITASGPQISSGPDEAREFSPEKVYDLAINAWKSNSHLDAIYFQGAVLDPLMIMNQLERDIGKPVIASNPSMLWHILTFLGLTYHIEGYGRLVRDWPAPSHSA